MKTDLSQLSLDELKAKKLKLEKANAHWISAQDGSYEMSLYHSGHTDVCEEIARRESND